MTTTNKPVLLLDMDGIIADFNRFSIRTYNDIHGTNLDEGKCDLYIYDHDVKDPSIDKKALRKPYTEPGAFINLPLIEGSQEGVARLSKFFEIYLLTTHYWSNPTCVYEKEVWLQRYFPALANNGIFTKHKPLVKGDVFVDDRPSNLAAWKAKNPEGKTGTLEYNWTDKANTDFCADNWYDLATKIIEGFWVREGQRRA